jgi:hypothetical protein
MIIAVADRKHLETQHSVPGQQMGRAQPSTLDAWLTSPRHKREAWLTGVDAAKPLRDTLESRVKARGANLQA